MAERSEKALAAVEKLFNRKPKASTEEFLAAAQKADSSLRPTSLRSFHSGYVLPFKRKASSKKPRRRLRKKKRTLTRKAVGRKKVGRKKKAARKKVAARKKAVTRKKASGRKKTRRGRPPLAPEEAVRRMVLRRDRDLLAAANDPHKTYELAASVDQFVRQIIERIGS